MQFEENKKLREKTKNGNFSFPKIKIEQKGQKAPNKTSTKQSSKSMVNKDEKKKENFNE